MMKLTFITGNLGKAKYLSDYFQMPVEHVKLDLKEIQSLDLEEVARDKAERAYEIMQSSVLVEDVSLVYKGMKALPGPLIKWFLETLGNEGLCRLADNLPTRDALAEVKFALRDENGTHIFSGSMEGTIAEHPAGEGGFGWDPIFIPKGYTNTWAEMADGGKHETSIRKQALEEMSVFLEFKP
jgi:non-canonical purine NTP pyrophosphatase (RdgB/HAM1 family)